LLWAHTRRRKLRNGFCNFFGLGHKRSICAALNLQMQMPVIIKLTFGSHFPILRSIEFPPLARMNSRGSFVTPDLHDAKSALRCDWRSRRRLIPLSM
jgi:hypothetical protein